jgi:hypothetical protein
MLARVMDILIEICFLTLCIKRWFIATEYAPNTCSTFFTTHYPQLSYRLTLWLSSVSSQHCEVSLRSQSLLSESKCFFHFMEHEGSLSCTQAPSTGPCLSDIFPDHNPELCFITFFLILSSHLRLSLLTCVIPLIFLDKNSELTSCYMPRPFISDGM